MCEVCPTFVRFCLHVKMLYRNLENFIVLENKFAEVRTAVRDCFALICIKRYLSEPER